MSFESLENNTANHNW